MLSASVPKATVNENGNFFAGKCNVDGTAWGAGNRVLHSIT
ncbi:hypothetical protein JN12_03010 [Geobacter argillaceus]|uniref:Uncharacterized protein n=1 Tax=Geobacter argillaceus TaxID=345631 RepID=A0A562VI68_9BACT|nr:hypothetical protein JN12_03010 [Geobacter argillaceus]